MMKNFIKKSIYISEENGKMPYSIFLDTTVPITLRLISAIIFFE